MTSARSGARLEVRRLAAVIALIVASSAALAGPGMAAERGAAAQAGSLSASIELADAAVYLKKDVVLKVTFKNSAEPSATVEAAAFAPGAFAVIDEKGRPAGTPAASADAASEPLTVPGYGTAERKVNLSSWYPHLSARRRTWQVSWAEGAWKAGPIRITVIQPYDPARDKTALVETDLGTMTWTLLPEYAPAHVEHFVALARQGFYEGLTIFRVIPGLQAEGGDPNGDGTGAWEHLMMPEIAKGLEVSTGMVGASRRESSMTSDSMFFITLTPMEFMTGKHTFYARLTDGWDVIAHLHRLETTGDTGFADAFLLKQPVRIRSVEIR